MLSSPTHRRPAKGSRTMKYRLHRSMLSLGLCVSLLGSLAYAVAGTWHERHLQQDAAQQLGRKLKQSIEENGSDSPWRLGFLQLPRLKRVQLFDPAGNPVQVQTSETVTRSTEPQSEFSSTWNSVLAEIPVHIPGQAVGTLQVEFDSLPAQSQFWLFLGVLISSTGLSLSLARIMARRLHQGITVNLLDLTRTANALSARQDYSIRARVRPGDEVGLLVEMFHHMIGQIQ